MAVRLSKKNVSAESPQPPSAPQEQAEGRFRLQVDRQTKATYPTLEAAEAAGLAIKKGHPIVYVGVYDHVEGTNKIIQTPET